jgi:hypothetical protein
MLLYWIIAAVIAFLVIGLIVRLLSGLLMVGLVILAIFLLGGGAFLAHSEHWLRKNSGGVVNNIRHDLKGNNHHRTHTHHRSHPKHKHHSKKSAKH